MADKKNPGSPKQPLQEDGVVARLKNASGGELTGLTTYTGLLGRSSKDGYWLLYPTLDMSTCIEIQESDVIHSEPLPPEQSPFGGLGGTLVFVRKGAQVTASRTTSRTSQAGSGDEFDLDLRVGQAESDQTDLLAPTTINGTICETPFCPSRICTQFQATCQASCQTCQTCRTCRTRCNQETCFDTCAPGCTGTCTRHPCRFTSICD
jgi:hypothetical protein